MLIPRETNHAKYYLTYQGIDHLKGGMEFRHDEQTERKRRTSVRLSRRVPIDFSRSRRSSDHWTGAMHVMFGFVEAELDRSSTTCRRWFSRGVLKRREWKGGFMIFIAEKGWQMEMACHVGAMQGSPVSPPPHPPAQVSISHGFKSSYRETQRYRY